MCFSYAKLNRTKKEYNSFYLKMKDYLVILNVNFECKLILCRLSTQTRQTRISQLSTSNCHFPTFNLLFHSQLKFILLEESVKLKDEDNHLLYFLVSNS